MGFNKRELPELDELKKIHERFTTDVDFIKYVVGKSDALFGPSESHRYLEEVYARAKSKKDD